ncbi:MAG: MFS transporter [Gammaproteobacteria bacterium]
MNQFDLLATRHFLPLFLTQFLGALNDNIFRFALVIFITFTLSARLEMDSKLLIPLSGGVFILPFFLFSSLAGQIADKYEKSLVIRRLKLLEIAVMGLGAVGFWLSNTYLLFFVLFCMGTQSTFFGPLKYGILPQHLTDAELTGGNGLIQMGTYSAIIIGVVLGGFLAALKGFGPMPVVSAVLGVAVCGFLAASKIPPAEASDPSLRINPNIIVATYRIVAYVAKNRELLVLTLTISWFWFIGATFLSMVPTYGKENLNADEHVVTLLNAAFTIGIAIGSIICERFSRGRIELGLVPVGCLGISLFAGDFYFSALGANTDVVITVAKFFHHPASVRAFVDLLAVGTFGAIFIIPLYAALQARSDSSRCSRVMAALNITNALFMVASAVGTIMLYTLGLTIPEIFGLLAALNIIMMLIAAYFLPEFATRLGKLVAPSRN